MISAAVSPHLPRAGFEVSEDVPTKNSESAKSLFNIIGKKAKQKRQTFPGTTSRKTTDIFYQTLGEQIIACDPDIQLKEKNQPKNIQKLFEKQAELIRNSNAEINLGRTFLSVDLFLKNEIYLSFYRKCDDLGEFEFPDHFVAESEYTCEFDEKRKDDMNYCVEYMNRYLTKMYNWEPLGKTFTLTELREKLKQLR